MFDKGNLIWLPENPSKDLKSAVRSRAAAWGHHAVERKRKTKASGRPWAARMHTWAAQTHTTDPKQSSKPRIAECKCEKRPQEVINSQCTACRRLIRTRGLLIPLAESQAKTIPKGPSPPAENETIRLLTPFMARFRAMAGIEGRDWIYRVVSEAAINDALVQEAVDILADGMCNTSRPHWRNQMHARSRAAKVITQFQPRLSDPRTARLPSTLMLTFLLSLQELLLFDNPPSFFVHVLGTAQLLQLQGPRNCMQGIDHVTFKWFRYFGICLDILLRRPSFMDDPRWTLLPWSLDDQKKDLVDLVLDLLAQIPGLLAKGDICRVTECSTDGLDLSVEHFRAGMERWKYECMYAAPAYTACFGAGATVDLNSVAISLANGDITDFTFAQAYTLYLAGWLLLLRVSPHCTQILPLTPKELTRNVITVCSRYASHADEFGALPWIMQLRVAYFTPVDTDAESARVIEVNDVIKSQYSINTLNVVISTLPTFGGKLSLMSSS